jgi:hypothetical protein
MKLNDENDDGDSIPYIHTYIHTNFKMKLIILKLHDTSLNERVDVLTIPNTIDHHQHEIVKLTGFIAFNVKLTMNH